jgi:hypothetical protein
LRELPKSTTDALAEMEAMGAKFNISGKIFSSKELIKELKLGKVSTFEAMQSIAKEMDSMNLSTKQTAIANIFGAPGEDAGGKFFQMLKEGIPTMDSLVAQGGDLLSTQKMQLSYHEKINNEIAKFAPQMSTASTAIEGVKLEAELFFYQTVAKGVQWWEEHQAIINTILEATGYGIKSAGDMFYNAFILPTEIVLDAMDSIGVKWDWLFEKGKSAVNLFTGLTTGNVGKTIDAFNGIIGTNDNTVSMHDAVSSAMKPSSSGASSMISSILGNVKPESKSSPKSGLAAAAKSGMKLPATATDKTSGDKTTATGGVGGGGGNKNITIIVQNKINATIQNEGDTIDQFAVKMAEALAKEQRNVENM